MKPSILFVFFLMLTSITKAQTSEGYADITNLCNYGIDFSLAKVYGAKETPVQFVNAFNEINQLLLSEPKKYDIAKALGKRIVDINLSQVETINNSVIKDKLITYDNSYTVSEDQLIQLISHFDTGDYNGYGVLFVAGLLDKSDNRGTYTVVIFNTKTKQIIKSQEISGKASGFGLRNYWAGSVYKAIKELKYF